MTGFFSNRLPRLIALAFLCILGLAAPATAVTFGSSDGTGDMRVRTRYNNGYYTSGSIRSYSSSKRVYASGLVVYNFAGDQACGRVTDDVTSTSLFGVDGYCTNITGFGADGAELKLCRNLTGLPDPCGGWSSTTW